jgi:ribosomal protein S8
MVTDRLADMVSIINTGVLHRDQFVSVKKSKVNIQILYVLYKNGVINNFQICTDRLIVFLKYKNGKSILRHIKRYPSHNKKMQ